MIQNSQQNAIREEIVRAVVQGKLPMSALKEAGITFEVQENQPGGDRQIRVEAKAPLSIELRPIDIAHGLLTYKDQPEALRDWATFLLSDLEVIDLTTLESWPEGDELLSALWDASFEGRVKSAGIRVATALVDE
jgi:hypothetical protein